MQFISTRHNAPAATIDAALAAGLAPDGGLYVPSAIPEIDLVTPSESLPAMATRVLAPYVAGSRLEPLLSHLCVQAYAFDAPLRPLPNEGDHVLELFHGPTAAFKDYAACFLAAALGALREPGASTLTIVVATSGDTGAAVASAFHLREGFRVEILYPDGKVSPRQAHGLGCWGGNVRAWRVAGSFDDCQRMTKQVLADTTLRERVPLTSANSISLGRLLPQAAYYAHAAALHRAAHGRALGFVIPTGNLGNACAALLAQRMGAPIHGLHLATNANDALPRYLEGSNYAPHATVATLANAMDVGAPSNFERLRHWFASDAALRGAIRSTRVDDNVIRATIAQAPSRHGIVPCPHTATALHALERLRAQGDTQDWAVVATAHPAKFEGIVESLVGQRVAPPPALAECLARPAHAEPMTADATVLRAILAA
jgi:threonine synthase